MPVVRRTNDSFLDYISLAKTKPHVKSQAPKPRIKEKALPKKCLGGEVAVVGVYGGSRAAGGLREIRLSNERLARRGAFSMLALL